MIEQLIKQLILDEAQKTKEDLKDWVRAEMAEFYGPLKNKKEKQESPRVGQLCYVWDDDLRSAEKFQKFDDELFIDSDGAAWENWAFIPEDDIK
jgi:hypothetical protein